MQQSPFAKWGPGTMLPAHGGRCLPDGAGISIRPLVANTPPPFPFIIIKAKRGIGARGSPSRANYKHFCVRTVAHQCARRASDPDHNFSVFFKTLAFCTHFCPLATREQTRAPVRVGRALVRQCSPRHINNMDFCARAVAHQRALWRPRLPYCNLHLWGHHHQQGCVKEGRCAGRSRLATALGW